MATTQEVLQVLAGQSEGYLIQPGASAFVAAGLDPEEVTVILEGLQVQGLVEYQAVRADPDDDSPMESGWIITEAGREAMA